MEAVIHWCAYFGSWLLFAGSMYQAALELNGEDLAIHRYRTREEIPGGAEIIDRFPQASPWWWLLPPVKLLLDFRRRGKIIKAWVSTLDSDETETLTSFFHKATAWFIVGLGGFLIAAFHSWELAGFYHWPDWLLLIVIAGSWLMALAYTVNRMLRARRRMSRSNRR